MSTFDKHAKFKEVLHYIINKCGDKPNVAKTVIYKLLYFTDFDFYELKEKSLTGSEYRNIPLGPAPCEFDHALKDLKKDDLVKEIHISETRQIKYISVKPPKLDLLNAEEIEHINKEIQRLCTNNATQIAALSHEDVPVKATKKGNIIDYELVFYRSPSYSVREYDNG